MAKQPDPFQIRCELARCVPALLSCEAALPRRDELKQEHDFIAAAARRGYFLPDEEQMVVLRYSQYMAVRSALIQILEDMRRHAGRTSSARATTSTSSLIGLAAEYPVLWKKLDEANPLVGLPRKSFTHIYNEYSRPRNMTRLLVAIEFYRHHYEDIQKLADDPLVGPVVELLRREEPWMDLSKREALKRRASYRLFSFPWPPARA